MAQKVQVLLVDDIDGSEASETVTFSLDGVTYEIDLSPENASKLRKELARYVENARKASAPARRLRKLSRTGREQSARIREWARSRGYKVNERGRIPANIVYEYAGSGGGSSRAYFRDEATPAEVGVAHGATGDSGSQDKITPRTSQITIDVYLDTDDETVASGVFAAVGELAQAVGIENLTPKGSWQGSILKRFTGTTRSASAKKNVEDRLRFLESQLQSQQANPRNLQQAEEDQKISTAFAVVCDTIKDVPRACIRIGSLVVVKYPNDSGESILIAHELTLVERLIFEDNPQLQKSPETLFDVIALAQSEQIESLDLRRGSDTPKNRTALTSPLHPKPPVAERWVDLKVPLRWAPPLLPTAELGRLAIGVPSVWAGEVWRVPQVHSLEDTPTGFQNLVILSELQRYGWAGGRPAAVRTRGSAAGDLVASYPRRLGR